jgi:HEAT repeat protein
MDLKAAIAHGDENEIIEALRNIAVHPNGATIRNVKKLASETRSASVRNAAALALLDCKAPGTADLMTDLVMRPETRGSRGTLLYVLAELEATVPLPVLLDILTQDSHEARAEVLGLLAAADYSPGNVEHALPMLRNMAHSSDKEAAEHAREAIEILTSTD